MRKNDILELNIIDYGMNGEGVAKVDGIPVFIPFAMKGERVKAKIVYLKSDYAFGEVEEIIEKSKDRRKPYCIHFKKCGGCDIQHINYEKQLDIKRENVENTIRKNAGIDVDIKNIYYDKEFNYRNKLSLPFGKMRDRVVLGFYEKSSHNLIPLKFCPLHDEWVRDLIYIVTDWATKNKISVYNEETAKGLLRHLVARKLDTLSVTLVINGRELNGVRDLYNRLSEKFKDVTLYMSSNMKRTNIIMGNNVTLLAGKEIPQSLAGFSACISPLSFLQVNKEVMNLLYDKAVSYLDGRVLELYSGVGILTCSLAMKKKDIKITSVEIVSDAVLNAKKLIESLSLSDRVNAVCDDALDYVKKLKDNDFEKFKCVLLDPPRKGVDREILEGIDKAKIDRVVYISCNPATLSRDMKILNNYEIKDISLFDMFPNTSHVETLVCFDRKK